MSEKNKSSILGRRYWLLMITAVVLGTSTAGYTLYMEKGYLASIEMVALVVAFLSGIGLIAGFAWWANRRWRSS